MNRGRADPALRDLDARQRVPTGFMAPMHDARIVEPPPKAAVNRAQSSLKTYPQAPANEEGLLIMVKAYDALGMQDLRNDAERVMIKNFPNSKYLKGDAKRDAPWWQLWN